MPQADKPITYPLAARSLADLTAPIERLTIEQARLRYLNVEPREWR